MRDKYISKLLRNNSICHDRRIRAVRFLGLHVRPSYKETLVLNVEQVSELLEILVPEK